MTGYLIEGQADAGGHRDIAREHEVGGILICSALRGGGKEQPLYGVFIGAVCGVGCARRSAL